MRLNLLRINFDHRLALVRATLQADMMRKVILAAVLAHHQVLESQSVM